MGGVWKGEGGGVEGEWECERGWCRGGGGVREGEGGSVEREREEGECKQRELVNRGSTGCC